jgi:hypothetical protein
VKGLRRGEEGGDGEMGEKMRGRELRRVSGLRELVRTRRAREVSRRRGVIREMDERGERLGRLGRVEAAIKVE